MFHQALQILASQARVNVLKEKNPELAEWIDLLAEADPTKGKHKYLQWAVNRLKAKDLDLISVPQFVGSLSELSKRFHGVQSYMPKTDLNAYKDLVQLAVDLGVAEGEKAEAEAVENQEGFLYESKEEGYRLWEMTEQADVCRLGKGSKWCVSMKDSPHWDDYAKRDDYWFILIEDYKNKEKFLAYLVGDQIGEIKDWGNSEDSSAVQFITDAYPSYTYNPGVMDQEDEFDPEEHWERWRDEAWADAESDLEDTAERIVHTVSEEIFDEYMESAGEVWDEKDNDTYWDKAWAKYLEWADERIEKYFSDKLGSLGDYERDEWGYRGWDLEMEEPVYDPNDSASGYFSGQEDTEVYAEILVKEFLITQMGWKGETPPDEQYLEPWNELVDKVSRVASNIIRVSR